MKRFKELVKEARVEDVGFNSNAAQTLKEKPNKEPMPKMKEGISPSEYSDPISRMRKKENEEKRKSALTKEETDTTEKIEMVQSQLHFIKYACEEILDFIDDGGEVEEWYQVKVAKSFSEFESLHAYIEGESRRTGMKEEVEKLDELKTSTLLKYSTKANKSLIGGDRSKEEKRVAGINTAIRKIKNKVKTEEVEKLDEADVYSIKNKKTGQIYHYSKYPITQNSEKYKRIKAAGGDHVHAAIHKNDKPISEEVELNEENKPTNPELWSRAVSMAKSKFDVYPSAYANGWAAKWYKSKGGGWKTVNEAEEKDLPFTPDKPKKPSVIPGKYGVGYSTARALARRGLQQQIKKPKKPVKEAEERGTEPFLKTSRKAEIVKSAAKKGRKSDNFESEPVLSSTVTRNN